MKRISPVATLALLLIGGVALGQDKVTDKKPAATFGALDSMSAAEAQVKLTAWLKEVGKFDQAKLNAVWTDDQRSILDRVAESLALGDPIAAKLIAEARDPHAPAPVVLPAVFKNEKTSAFFRANLALYLRPLADESPGLRRSPRYAQSGRRRSGRRSGRVSLLSRGVRTRHARKAEANKTILRLLEEANAISPDRYKTVAALMLLDMHTWKDKDLGTIARKMDNIERRLDIARGGPETQRQQRDVLNRLDELIKKLENANKKKPGDGGGGGGGGGPPNDGDCPDGSAPGSGPAQGLPPPTSGATHIANATGSSTGQVDQAKFKRLVADWVVCRANGSGLCRKSPKA